MEAAFRGFHDDYTEPDWRLESEVVEDDRSFGFRVDGRWISTCGAFSRAMTVPGGRQVPTAAVTVVSVHAAYRRRGLLTQMMTHQLQRIADRGQEPLALLWASETMIYGRFGYGHSTPMLRISGDTRSTDFLPHLSAAGGSVAEVDRQAFLDHAPGLHAELLGDRPGALARTPGWWRVLLDDSERRRRGASLLRHLLSYDPSGAVEGYAVFRVKDAARPTGEVVVVDIDARGTPGYAALWRFMLDLDLVPNFHYAHAAVDEPLVHMVADRGAISAELTDGTYARLVDLPAALSARRYRCEVDTVIEVEDTLLTSNRGRWRLQAGPEGASVSRTHQSADLSLDVRELGTAYLGGTALTTLHRAGRVNEHTLGSVARLSTAFGWSRAPFCPDHF
jgi:predicted acetyltransferase